MTRLVVARIGRAHGIRGEVTVAVHTDVPDERFVPGAVLLAGERRLVVETARDHNGVQLLTFEGVDDRNAAEALRGTVLETEVDDEAEREDDAWYDHELIGLQVRDLAGAEIGTVVGVEHLPAQDLLEVQVLGGGKRLVPLVGAFVTEVDPGGGYLVLDAPPGLLSDI